MGLITQRRAMTESERAGALRVLEAQRARSSVWRMAAGPLILGGILAGGGLVVLLTFATSGVGQPSPSLGLRAIVLASAIASVVGVCMFGYGVVQGVLGSLIAGRSRDAMNEAEGLIRAEIEAGQVDEIEMRISGATAVDSAARGRAWIARCGGDLVGVDSGELMLAGASPLLERVRVVVLPTSRRVLEAAVSGAPVAIGAARISASDVPDFARGYRALREDHFAEEVRGKLP